MLADIIGGIGCIEIPVFLQHREKPNGKLLVFSVPALSTMFPECSQDEDVDEVEGLFNNFVNGVAFDEKYVFVSEVHTGNEV